MQPRIVIVSLLAVLGCNSIVGWDDYIYDGSGGAAGSASVSTASGSGGLSGSFCGDGERDPPETCDDGNVTSGDGCDDHCVTEQCYECTVFGTCTPVSPGTSCGFGGMYCDLTGHCVSHCDNEVLDADETDTDCGGYECIPCETGQQCFTDSDCMTFICADSVCCTKSCDASCRACNIPGMIGDCVYVPPGVDDWNTCIGDEITTCDGAGYCVTSNLQNGLACASPPDCQSEVCSPVGGQKYCGLPGYSDCSLDQECASQSCKAGTCDNF
jgi:cysteine-rich repeat protein